MTNDSQSRKWQITINNPVEKGYTHEKIKEIFSNSKNIIYYCFSDEVGSNGTFHTHIYCVFGKAVRFSTLLKRFEGGHFEMCKGTSQQNRDYVFKEGKYLNSEKETTNIKDSHFEFGSMPIERQGKRNDLDDLYDMIRSGMSTYDIITEEPSFLNRIDVIDKVRNVIMSDKFSKTYRDVNVNYIWGPPGVGKTRFIYDNFKFENVYRVTNYQHPFDGYSGQDIIVFDEFFDSIKFEEFMAYTDIYPINLPARYCDRVACYTQVFIISNVDLRSQYMFEQKNKKEQYPGFLRRIHTVMYWDKTINAFRTKSTKDYLNAWLSSDEGSVFLWNT